MTRNQRPDRVAEFIEPQSVLLAALGRLSREQCDAFLLHEETGLTVDEIARVTDIGRDAEADAESRRFRRAHPTSTLEADIRR